MRRAIIGLGGVPFLLACCGTQGIKTAGTNAAASDARSAFYVSPAGNDRSEGSLAAPFATLERAREAMRRGSVKTTHVERGTYRLDRPIDLSAEDSGETWQYYPQNGANTAVLDGGTATLSAFHLKGASNVTIDGLKMQNFTRWTIFAYSSPGALIENNDIGYMTLAPPAGNAGASIGISVGDHATVRNNYLHDLSSIAIAAFAYNAGDTVEGTTISGNVVLRSDQKSSDDGAIYVNMKGTGGAGGHVIIRNNFVRDIGGAGFTALRDIYLDDNSSNVTVTGNVLGPPAAGVASSRGNVNAIFVHNGNNNTISGNIIDLGASGFVNIVTWGYDKDSLAGMVNNLFTNNIILSNFAGENRVDSGWGNYAYLEGGPNAKTSWIAIADNLYWNYARGGKAFFNGDHANDANPIVVNPQISGATYTIADGSPVFNTPLKFPRIVGGWGPPGFAIPEGGNRSPP